MTDHQHAAPDPDPGPGSRPAPGTGPDGAVPGAGAGEEPRAHEQASAPQPDGRPGTAGEARPTGEEDVTGTTGAAEQPDAPTGPRPAPDTRTGTDQEARTGTGPEGITKFRRARQHRMIAGVCAGLGRQCDMDPVIFRITLSVLAATGGIGLIFYGLAWLFVPYEDEDENEVRRLLTGRVDGQTLAAVMFALVGCGVFLSMLGNANVLTFGVVLSLLLAGAGYWSQHRGAPDSDPLAAQAVADAPPEAQAPPVPAAYPSWWRDPIVKDGTHVGGTGYLWGPPDAQDRDIAAAAPVSLGLRQSTGTRPAHPQPLRPRGPRRIGGWIFLLALLACGLGTGLTWHDHALGTSLQTGLACALAVLGLGLAVSAFLGRTGAGSVLLALVTAALLAGSSALPENITTRWGHRTWQPAATAEVRRTYDLGTGEGTLDLTRIRPGKEETVSTAVHLGVGRLRVIVPPDVTVRATINVGVGDIRLPGEHPKDVDVAPGRHRKVTLPSEDGGKDGAGTLEIALHVGLGQAEVSRAAS
ncbi:MULTISPECIES: PspC domain-containing protein [Streptomyces]|uniref:PspC domain-containing protein n=1 Tax=Streptomyces thermogriseus TaxID=75292 RepID=A0ABP4DS41_9ACTN|nr:MULTISPECIES: PspC domain-containing protein [Streptomyces]MDN5384324.1 PspC domain-containing protein [Streptomyces sp. LB8]